MCLNKDFLQTFESIDTEKVLLGNNLAYKVVGIGTISLKMFDSVTKDLNQVRYVPELKSNLISLGMIGHLGYIIKVGNGKLRGINKGAVIIKGARRNGLYILIGTSSSLWFTASASNEKIKL